MSKKEIVPVTAEDEINEKPVEQEKPATLVYCGPSVKNVARQFTVYSGKLPPTLEEFLNKHPAARALTVKTEDFPSTRRNLEIKGTMEAVLYNTVKAEI